MSIYHTEVTAIQKGIIFNIQRYSIHDGPGIRTTVFMKGCNLSCIWCQNPESIVKIPEIQFLPFKCSSCMKCVEICPNNARKAVAGEMVYLRESCKSSGKCTRVCFFGASTWIGKSMDSREVLEVVERDAAFYKRSGGGVTFSGGEPMLQIGFLRELLEGCKKRNLHTTVDTACNVPWKYFKEIMPYTDLFLCDLKIIDERTHKKYIGTGNKKILNTIRKLSSENKKIIFRIPIIPGINASIEEMGKIADFIKSLDNGYPVELLAFHQHGSGKYINLGKKYFLKELKPPRKEDMKKLKKVFTKKGLKNIKA